jgi:hypothetical protein
MSRRPFDRDQTDLILTAVKAAVDKVARDAPAVHYSPGTVVSYQPTIATRPAQAYVHLDGDTDPDNTVPCPVLLPHGLASGDRVMCVFSPPHAHYIAGILTSPDQPTLSQAVMLSSPQTIEIDSTTVVTYDAYEFEPNDCPLVELIEANAGRVRVIETGTYIVGVNLVFTLDGQSLAVCYRYDGPGGNTDELMRSAGAAITIDDDGINMSRRYVFFADDEVEVSFTHSSSGPASLAGGQESEGGPRCVLWFVRLSDCGTPLPVEGKGGGGGGE